jgi:hypothetical protein
VIGLQGSPARAAVVISFWHHHRMTDWESEITRRAAHLAQLTLDAARGPEPKPEDDVAELGMLIATERQLLIDACTAALRDEDPDAAAQIGVAEFDAGFRYGLMFARALEEARLEIERTRRGRVLSLVPRREGRG